jgi:fructose-1,6-bisphosphatase II
VARTPEERRKGEKLGFDFERMLGINDLVRSTGVFFATPGFTNGDLLHGVDYYENGARTEAL